MSVTAERLDLITNVRDQFSDDLMMLSAQLETAGTLADRLSPMRLRVNVNDRQLDQTLGKLSAIEAIESKQSFSIGRQGRVSDGMAMLFGDEENPLEEAFTFDSTASDILEDNLTSLNDTLNETTEDLESAVERDPATEQIGSVQQMTVGAVGAMAIGTEGLTGGIGSTATDLLSSRSMTDGGASGGGSQGLSPGLIREAQERFSLNLTDERMLAPDITPAHFIEGSGMGSLFQVTPDELGKYITPQALHKSLDVDGILSNIHFLDSPTQLAGAKFGDILRNVDGGISSDEFFERFFDTRRLRFEQLKEAFFDIRIGMTQFYDFLAALMPLMFVLIGSMPAVIGALSGLGAAALGAAGGLAAIAGLGLMGAAGREAGGDRPGFEDLQEVLSDIPDDFYESFRGVAQRLEPEFERMMGGLSSMFDDLAYRFNRVLTETGIREMGRDFGRWLIPFIGETTEGLVRMADASRGVFSMISRGLGDRDILAGLAFSLANVLPQLMTLSGIILDALPTIARFSAGMTDMFTSILGTARAVGGFITSVADLVWWFGDGTRMLGRLTGGFFALMSATFLATKVAAIFRADLMKLIIAKAAATKWSKLLSAGLYKQAAAQMYVSATSKAAALGVTSLAGAFKALMAATGIGALLVAAGYGIMQLTDWFIDLEGSVTDATDALQEFDRQQRSMAGNDGVYTGSLDRQTYVDVTDNSQTTITGSSESMVSNAEYANFLDQDRMDQLFS